MDTYCFRVAITQTRFNVLPLNNNVHRYSDHDEDKNCPFCKTKVENEFHFLLECAMYADLREKFLQDRVNIPLCQVLKATNSNDIHNLSRYVFHAINRRKKIIM
jgi:hypothetical protein